MPLDDTVRAAAERHGVQQQFWDIFGQLNTTAPETNRAILTSMGLDCSSEEKLAGSLARSDAAEWGRLLPPVLVVSENDPLWIPVRSPAELTSLDVEILLEDGQKRSLTIDPGPSIPDKRTTIAGVAYVERQVEIPRLPLGYHDVSTGDCRMRLIVAPDSAYHPELEKQAGLGVTLYGLRSRRNWGCGDFRDLHDLIDWAVPALHASFIALNPLHAIHNRTPYNASPYLPNSIFYRNFLYLDVEGVPGFDLIRKDFLDAVTRTEIEQLRGTENVEYEKTAKLKRRALDLIFAAAPPAAYPDDECRRWVAAEGDLLRLYATYCALDEHLHAENPDLWVWTDWPEEYRDPASPAVAEFARAHPDEILFHGWLQWLIDQQIGAVQRHAKDSGMSVGLYHDLALATDRCGSDLWAHRPFYVHGARVGSPPDGFSPTGQDWSFPPPDESRHRADGYRLYTESIRKTMRHGGALRIDHVMRLFRLYWIPEGCDARHGAYVKDRPEDLVRILALESVRNQSFIVGEDLGTVEAEVRQTLARFGILSYRLLIFEREGSGFRHPDNYPRQALASTTTHDLPTIAGFWTGRDIETRLETGTIDRKAYLTQQRERVQDKQHLLDLLFSLDLMPAHYERDATRIPEMTGELHYAVAGFLARTPAALWLINQEDITRDVYQQNMPGTTAEYPNWCRKMHWTMEELTSLPEARDCAAMFRIWVERSGRA